MQTPIIPENPHLGLVEESTAVSKAELQAYITQYTTPPGKHLGRRLLAVPAGYNRLVYPDTSDNSPFPGRVMAYENHHPTDETLHTYYLVTPPKTLWESFRSLVA
jgi:hypothetical protein